MYRFYTDKDLVIDTYIELDRDELHHLKKVLRVRPKEKIEIVNGNGELAIGYYEDTIKVLSVDSQATPQKTLSLIQAIPEKSHLEFILEKGTEIGITDFIFFPAEKSKIKEISDSFLLRMKKITISAMKQCKRLYLPTISILKIDDLKELSYPLYIGDPNGKKFLPPSESAGFIIGPESGFSKKELNFLKTECMATSTTLSSNILRAETASIVAAYLICSC
ncbi:MAG: 16S rRNA (uracil(1498)-N(3))-methyltransferase [Chlamydiae bacterium]|nr:16S rRNA (uracil(1498)-N(3))-methyltransferase [Chlamydiota bacterium]